MPGVAGQQLFDAAVEPACALRAFAQGGQHTQAPGLLQGKHWISRVGQCAPVAQQVLALATQRIGLTFVEMHAGQFTAAQQLQCCAAVALAHGVGQRCQIQRIALPVAALQLHAAPGEGAWCGLRLQDGRRQKTMQCLRVISAGTDAITAGTQPASTEGN